jgi:hypothetical protein
MRKTKPTIPISQMLNGRHQDTFIKNQYTSNKHRDTKIVESK